METETKTDNELIAEFMGVEHKPDFLVKSDALYWHYNELHIMCETLQFDTSWDWLMPVVEKIAKMDVSFINSGLMAVARHKAVTEMLKTCDIGIVYKAVLEFIKWYNG